MKNRLSLGIFDLPPGRLKFGLIRRINRMKPLQGFKPAGMPVFWRRPQNADLDRAGELLLANLENIRKEAKSRGDSR